MSAMRSVGFSGDSRSTAAMSGRSSRAPSTAPRSEVSQKTASMPNLPRPRARLSVPPYTLPSSSASPWRSSERSSVLIAAMPGREDQRADGGLGLAGGQGLLHDVVRLEVQHGALEVFGRGVAEARVHAGVGAVPPGRQARERRAPSSTPWNAKFERWWMAGRPVPAQIARKTSASSCGSSSRTQSSLRWSHHSHQSHLSPEAAPGRSGDRGNDRARNGRRDAHWLTSVQEREVGLRAGSASSARAR